MTTLKLIMLNAILLPIIWAAAIVLGIAIWCLLIEAFPHGCRGKRKGKK